jgi:hypothetical protein
MARLGGWFSRRSSSSRQGRAVKDSFHTARGAPRRVKIIWVQPSLEGGALSGPFIVQDRVPRHVTNLAFDDDACAPAPFGAEPEAFRCAQ